MLLLIFTLCNRYAPYFSITRRFHWAVRGATSNRALNAGMLFHSP